MPDDHPAHNNITVRGNLPADMVPSPTRSRTLPEAHMKTLRMYRKWCRYMPFVINWTSYRKYATPEQAKLTLASQFRTLNRVRDIDQLDAFVFFGYHRLYSIQQGDIWNGQILEFFAPSTNKGVIDNNDGFSFLDETKFGEKSDFLKSFYKGNRPNY